MKEPLKAFNNLLGEGGLLMQHQRNHYYKPQADMANQISTQRMAQVAENRDRLRHLQKLKYCVVVKIYHYAATETMASANTDHSDVSSLERNFRVLLKFRIDAGDSFLEFYTDLHKQNCAKRTSRHL